jgi:release factor glutamine methyltransferase
MRLDKHKLNQAARILERRISAEPIQYILGKTEFMGLEFRVNKDVFIPRPETEILVEAVIDLVTKSSGHQVISILDIGTGSGNIAISLAKFINNCKIVAVDISKQAMAVAKKNAAFNGVEDKISFINQDFFSLRHTAGDMKAHAFDFIVSNPPYIPSPEIKSLQPEIAYEPSIALDGGIDGLDFYPKIIKQAPFYLKQGALLIMEMGLGQRASIKNFVKKSARLKLVEIIKDYSNIERIIITRKKDG